MALFRKNTDSIKEKKYQFDWSPRAESDIDQVPEGVIRIAEQLIEKGSVRLSPKLDNDRMEVTFDSYCIPAERGEGDTRPEYADLSSEVIVAGLNNKAAGTRERTILLSKEYEPKRSMRDACRGCSATSCPYIVAARLLYLRGNGLETKVVPSGAYGEGKFPSTCSAGDYGFELKDIFFENITRVSDKVYNTASFLAKNRYVTLGKELFQEEGKNWVRVYCAFDVNDFASPARDRGFTTIAREGKKMTYWETSALALDESAYEWEQILATAAVLGCAEAIGRDITQYIDARETKPSGIADLAAHVKGLDRIISLSGREKTNFLRCTVEGEYERGRADTVKKIASVLAQTDKINSDQVFEVSFGELAHEFTEYINAGEQVDEADYRSHHDHYPGYIHRSFEPRRLYMVTGLSDLLRDRDDGNDSADIRRIEMINLIRTLGSVEKDTYVAVVGYKREIDRFFALDSKIRFLFGENRLVYPDMSAHEIYEMYLEGLSGDVAVQIEDREAHKKEFIEYLAFNQRAIPFDNDELADYLAGFSNSEGKPTLPCGIYDSGKLSKKLESIIGMKAVKEQLFRFRDYIAFRKKAETENLKLPDANLHMLFTGNAGTGKTMIARIVATMLYEIGFLPEDRLVEVERKDLVAAYLGQTAGKTAAKIADAAGGVLFIDEAYTLIGDQYGEEAIATLLKAMEDRRDELVIIFAGYPDLMQKFLDANPGLSSRIGYKFHFDDYSPEELSAMLEMKVTRSGLTMTGEAREKAESALKYFAKRKNFGNGRFVDTLWQEILIQHSLSASSPLTQITADDVPGVRALSTRRSGDSRALRLEDLVGLSQVKEQVRRFRTRVAFENRAKEYGVEIPRGNSHMLFTGNAGTGKTTVARILVDELYEAGVILEKKLTEVTAKDLIAEYVGQTAPKTQAVIDRAMGGVLFVDEAYALVSGGDRYGFGQDAVSTLIKAMEDCRDQFVVIFAGYEREMQDFLAMNTGIASRIGYTFHFEDYDADALTEIFRMKVGRAGLRVAQDDTADRVRNLMQYFVSVPNFGNGRFAEKVSEATYAIHAENCREVNDPERIVTVTAEDIPSVEYMIALMPDGQLLNPSEVGQEQNERTAVHELGHALLTMLCFPQAGIDRITIAAEGSGALGYVSSRGMLGATNTADELKRFIAVLMAGIASEKVFLGAYANGGTSDLEKATDLAWNMISRFGMSQNGFAVRRERTPEADREINEILGERFEFAQSAIEAHREALNEAKRLLLAKKTLTQAELADILGLNAQAAN